MLRARTAAHLRPVACSLYRSSRSQLPQLVSRHSPQCFCYLTRTMTSAAKRPEPVQGRDFSVTLVQLGEITGDKSANIEHARQEVTKAIKAAGKPDLVVMPEVWNSPYLASNFPKYAERINFNEAAGKYDMATCESESVKMLSELAKEHGVWLIGGSVPERAADGKIYNTCPILSADGSLVAIHRKIHLFDIDIPGGITFTESETLTGGQQLTIVETPFGKLGVGICYDVRFPELAMIAARRGCIGMVYPGAFNTTTGPLHWDLLQRARAVDNQLYVIMCSPARSSNKDDYQAWGYSGVTNPMGKIVAQLDEKPGALSERISVEDINKTRMGIPVSVQRRFDVYPDVAQTDRTNM